MVCGKKWRREEDLEKCEVEEAKKGAYKGRGEPLERRIVKKEKMSASEAEWRLLGENFSHGSEERHGRTPHRASAHSVSVVDVVACA